jgi:hypothetical protein
MADDLNFAFLLFTSLLKDLLYVDRNICVTVFFWFKVTTSIHLLLVVISTNVIAWSLKYYTVAKFFVLLLASTTFSSILTAKLPSMASL